jgi:hypothetical protein
MTNEDIIRMAREAGFEFNSLGATYTSGWLPDLLARFANLVAKAEREECARIADNNAECEPYGHGKFLAGGIADEIRARGKE